MNPIELAHDEFGDRAGEVILLISGLGVQRIRWTRPFCEELAGRGYRVIRFENRGCGGSTHQVESAAPDLGSLVAALRAGKRPQVPYSLRDMAGDVVALMDALAIPGAHVVGRSMGGMIAQIMASEHPDRVLSLTSIMSSTGNPALPQAAPDLLALMVRPTPDPASDRDGFVRHALEFARRIAGSGYPFDEEAHREVVLEELRRGHDPGGFRRQLAAMVVAGDRRPRLATIKVPTLVVHGLDDPLIPPACGEDTASSIPDAQLLLIEGMGLDLPPGLYGTLAEAIDALARRSGVRPCGEARH